MLFLLSPAKSLDYDTPVADAPHTLPQFLDRSAELIAVRRGKADALKNASLRWFPNLKALR